MSKGAFIGWIVGTAVAILILLAVGPVSFLVGVLLGLVFSAAGLLLGSALGDRYGL